MSIVIWGYEVIDDIETEYLKFCKRVASKCSKLHLLVTYMSKWVKYWAKLTQMERHRYPRQCYIVLRPHCDWDRLTGSHTLNYYCLSMDLATYGWLMKSVFLEIKTC